MIFHILLTGQFPFSTSEDGVFKAWRVRRSSDEKIKSLCGDVFVWDIVNSVSGIEYHLANFCLCQVQRSP